MLFGCQNTVCKWALSDRTLTRGKYYYFLYLRTNEEIQIFTDILDFSLHQQLSLDESGSKGIPSNRLEPLPHVSQQQGITRLLKDTKPWKMFGVFATEEFVLGFSSVG